MAINELAHKVNKLLIDTNLIADNYDRAIKLCLKVNREMIIELEKINKTTDDKFIKDYNKGYGDALKLVNERLLTYADLEEKQIEEAYKWKTI